MANIKKLDLRQTAEVQVYIDHVDPPSREYVVKFEDLPNNVATLTIGTNTYTVGDGLSVVDDVLLWTFTRSDFSDKRTVGKLESTSIEADEYYRIKIILELWA